ncbi:MAG TPA: oligosaccharide flippase family protein [Bryobacteraceae bacterium]|nr:oligosaccharide flippase family protein [Bryobacteraceae bacterium]
MSDFRQLIRQSSHYFGGKVGLLLLGFISFPLFTRLYSLAEYGLINLVIKIILMLTALSKLGLQNSVSRFYKEYAISRDPGALPTYFSSIFFGSVGISAVFATVFALGVAFSPAWLLSAEVRRLLVLASVLLFTGTLRSILINFLRAEERTRLYNALDITIKAVSIGMVCVLCFVSGATAASFVKGTIVSELVGLVLIMTPLVRDRMIRWQCWQYRFFRKALLFGMPLIGLELGNLLLDSGDRLLVARFLGAEALGLYSAASNIAGYIQDLLMAPVLLAVFPMYINLWTARGPEATRRFLSTSLQGFVCVGIGVIAIVAPTADPAVRLLASSKFAPAAPLVPVLVVGLILFATVPFFTAGLYLHNQTTTIAVTTIAAAIVNLGLNAVLLPRMGLLGGAFAAVLGYMGLLVVTAHLSSRYMRLEVRPGIVLRCVLAGVVAATPSFFIHTGWTVTDLAAKGAITGCVYLVLVYLGDRRIKALGDEALQSLRRRAVAVESEA